LRGANGAFRWFLTRVTPFRNVQGQIVRWFGTNTDIDDLRRAREERETLLLREREARSAAELLNRLGPLLLTELDLDRLVQSVTDLARELTGAEFGAFFYKVVDQTGEIYSLYTLSGAPREAFERFPMPTNTAVFAPTFYGHGVLRSDDITKDSRYGHNPPHYGMPKGHLPVSSYLAVPVVSRCGQTLGGLFFGHSERAKFTSRHESIVTGIAAHAAIAMDNATLFEETRRAQRDLQIANEELRCANSDLEQFAYSASHDLKEPLRNVAIYSDLIGRKCGYLLDTQAQGFLTQLGQNARRMDSLVKDLLSFTQIGGSSAETEYESANAADVLKDLITNLVTTRAEPQAEITHESLPLDVRIDRIHLELLLQNLITNALKYRSHQPPHIHIAAQVKDEHWLFSVADNGIGILPEHQERIFGIFKRLHTTDQYPGTGMGLAICKRIVERYHGRIWVESRPGHGSTFFFTVPV
jgi:signal transduction histidine kinase